MKLSQILLVISVVLGAAFSQAKTEAKKSTAAKDATLSQVSGTVKWVGYGVGKSHAGTLAVKSGEVVMTKNSLTQLNLVIDMKSLDTKDSDKLKSHLKSPDFFDVDKYAEASFKSTKIDVLKTGGYEVTGALTIKDKTEPITVSIAVSEKDGKWMAQGGTEIKDRTKYGINYHSSKFETVSKLGDKLIQDNIKLDIEMTAAK